ncbi:response regulator transcription factor [Acidovorax sp. 69]|uniref:response regulator n=1 Tax=Acidovorax sp. 69 TaxID=2035202 RepID=UPI000C2413BD|nr:response regulator transcription factor [Acidovorax sp. 69]
MFEPSPVPQIRVALVEDDVFFARALADAIHAAPDVYLHSLAVNCQQALQMLAQPAADVLLVDLGLPDGSGLDVIRAAQRQWPRCMAMVSSVFGDESHVIQSLEAGATGYLLKDSTPALIVEEIRNVHAGGSPISPLIARQLLTRFRQTLTTEAAPSPPQQACGPQEEQARLSPRERQVLDYITKGFSYEEIGGLMGVSRNTVLSFVRRIYAKLKVRSQLEAIYEARVQGLLHT